MFGQKKKLLSGGAQAEGVAIKAWVVTPHYINVRVRASFPDGSTGEFEQTGLLKISYGSLWDGDVVPVRYDPGDHSKVTIDLPALEKKHKEERGMPA